MKKKVLSLAVAAALLGPWSLAGAAPQTEDANMAFRAAYLAAPTDSQMLRGTLDLLGPSFHGDAEGQGQILRDGTMSWQGTLNWDFTDPATNKTSHRDIPYYLEQLNGSMTLYVNMDGRWQKISLPALPVGLADAWKGTDVNVLNDNLTTVKSSALLEEDAAKQNFRVVLDGNKLAQLVAKRSGAVEKDEQLFFSRLTKALTRTDVTVDWVVDKKTYRTITTNIDLTDLMRSYAREVLQEAADGTITLSDSDRNYYDSLGYYTELKIYLSSNGVQKQSLSLPAAAKQADGSGDPLASLRQEMATAVKR